MTPNAPIRCWVRDPHYNAAQQANGVITRYKRMGKTYRKEKQYKKAREGKDSADHGHHHEDMDHERTELRRQRQDIKRNWREQEDGE